MVYINFREEKFVAKKQLKKRKENNEQLFEEIIKQQQLGGSFNPFKEYSYKLFEDRNFGKEGLLNEEKFYIIENKDIVCATFKKCKFSNIKFKGCQFIGCIFDNCDFEKGGISFENCNFFKEDSDKKPSLNRKDNLSCYFKNCRIYAKFLNCILGFSIFEKCNIHYTNFEQSDMESTIIIESKLKMIVISDCDLSGAKIINTCIEDLEFKDKFQSKLDEKSFIDKIPILSKTREEYEGIYMCYETIANKFKENNLTNNFGEYYYLCKSAQRKSLKLFPKIESTIYWLTCGYGERAEYCIISSLVLILIFAIVYLLVGVEINNEIVIYNWDTIRNLTLNKFLNDLNESLSLSIGTFGGVGTINCDPTSKSYMITNIEVIVGIIMMGVGTGTLVRKIVR